jgi:hypothetical protein
MRIIIATVMSLSFILGCVFTLVVIAVLSAAHAGGLTIRDKDGTQTSTVFPGNAMDKDLSRLFPELNFRTPARGKETEHSKPDLSGCDNMEIDDKFLEVLMSERL